MGKDHVSQRDEQGTKTGLMNSILWTRDFQILLARKSQKMRLGRRQKPDQGWHCIGNWVRIWALFWKQRIASEGSYAGK